MEIKKRARGTINLNGANLKIPPRHLTTDMPPARVPDLLVTTRTENELLDTLGFSQPYTRRRKAFLEAVRSCNINTLSQGKPMPCSTAYSAQAWTLASKLCLAKGPELWADGDDGRPSWAQGGQKYTLLSIFEIRVSGTYQDYRIGHPLSLSPCL